MRFLPTFRAFPILSYQKKTGKTRKENFCLPVLDLLVFVIQNLQTFQCQNGVKNIEIKKPKYIIVKNTVDSIQAGLVLGHIGQTIYIIDQLKKELNMPGVMRPVINSDFSFSTSKVLAVP